MDAAAQLVVDSGLAEGCLEMRTGVGKAPVKKLPSAERGERAGSCRPGLGDVGCASNMGHPANRLSSASKVFSRQQEPSCE
jgi:hypothetical protein